MIKVICCTAHFEFQFYPVSINVVFFPSNFVSEQQAKYCLSKMDFAKMDVVSATLIPRRIRGKRCWNPSRSASKVTARISTKKRIRVKFRQLNAIAESAWRRARYVRLYVYMRVRFLSYLRYAIAE